MKKVSVKDLKKRLENGEDIEVIDVREPDEFAAFNIEPTYHIPMGSIPENLDKIAKDKPVVIYCRSGNRSGQVVSYLESQGYDNVYNLEGGMMSWARDIDPNIVF